MEGSMKEGWWRYGSIPLDLRVSREGESYVGLQLPQGLKEEGFQGDFQTSINASVTVITLVFCCSRKYLIFLSCYVFKWQNESEKIVKICNTILLLVYYNNTVLLHFLPINCLSDTKLSSIWD